MTALFYGAGAVAIVATALVVTQARAVSALLYLVVSLLAVALVFFALGAPFAAALEVIVYAGAIVVLFVFVVMLVNPGEAEVDLERTWLKPRVWAGPSLLSLVLLGLLGWIVLAGPAAEPTAAVVGPKAVGIALWGPYMLAAEAASILLMAGLVGAWHLGRKEA